MRRTIFCLGTQDTAITWLIWHMAEETESSTILFLRLSSVTLQFSERSFMGANCSQSSFHKSHSWVIFRNQFNTVCLQPVVILPSSHLLPNSWFSIQLGKYLTNVLLKKKPIIIILLKSENFYFLMKWCSIFRVKKISWRCIKNINYWVFQELTWSKSVDSPRIFILINTH